MQTLSGLVGEDLGDIAPPDPEVAGLVRGLVERFGTDDEDKEMLLSMLGVGDADR